MREEVALKKVRLGFPPFLPSPGVLLGGFQSTVRTSVRHLREIWRIRISSRCIGVSGYRVGRGIKERECISVGYGAHSTLSPRHGMVQNGRKDQMGLANA